MKNLLIIASLLISTSAFANDVDPNGFEKQHSISSLSRTDVKADLQLAQKQGLLPLGELGVKAIEPLSIKTRAQVAAEAAKGGHVYGEMASVE